MTLHAGSTPAIAIFSMLKENTPENCGNNFTSLQDLLINLSGGPLKLMQISTRGKKLLVDHFVNRLSAIVT
jgi:hypothetical protein